MYKKIIIPFDGTEKNLHDLLRCKELAYWPKAEIHLLGIEQLDIVNLGAETTYYNYHSATEKNKNHKKILEQGVDQLKQLGWHACGTIRQGDLVSQVAQYAHEISADLVLTTLNEDGNWLKRELHTRLVSKLANVVPCSLLITKSNT